MECSSARATFRYDVFGLAGGLVVAIIFIGAICDSQNKDAKELTLGKIEEFQDQNDCLATGMANGERFLTTNDLGTPILLWLGNSQLTTVNNRTPDQLPFPILVHNELIQRGVPVVAFGPPNGNLQEHLVLFHAVSQRRKVGVLLLPVCFDDFREDGVRPDIAIALQDENVRAAVASTDIGRGLVEATLQANPTPEDQKSTQHITEEAINHWLSSVLPYWEARGRARSMIAVWLYQLRNTVFGINPQSVRPVLATRYKKNMEALDALLAAAKQSGVNVLVYVPPLRTDIPSPYHATQYAKFKEELKAMTDGRGRYADYERLVPGPEWETKKATTLGASEELDFMHFAYSGHTRFRDKLLEDLVEFGWIPPSGGRP